VLARGPGNRRVARTAGAIGLGIAQAGAATITLSGCGGGTGAARQPALRHVGLPSDIGTRAVHRALMEAGIRNRVEIWADGGYRHGWDIVKLHMLGANRVGFGTLAMVALGCTICRGCQLDTCHVGIATQIVSAAEATERGLRRFEPQEFEQAVTNLMRFFSALRDELARITALLGVSSTEELVGRTDLLAQARGLDRIDLSGLLAPAGPVRRGGRELRVLAAAGGPSVEAHAGDESEGPRLGSEHRFVATATAGQLARQRIAGAVVTELASSFGQGSVAGNG